MRAAPLALLLTLSFLLGAEATNKHKEKHHPHRQQHSTTKRSSEDQPESPIPASITPFVAGREYCFEYNSQVSSGYAPWISGQQASSRLQSRVCLTCVAAEQCVLKMYKAKAGQRNAEAGDWSNQDSWDQAAHILPSSL
uniref:Uncharacterized protein n=1 Tax=Ditylenchus dipsaci TaxID=166011 RepID=A0A915DYN3_9BILA